MPRLLAAALAAWICAPASAHALAFAFSGTVISDDFGLLDADIANGPVSGIYEVDPSDVIGTSPFAVGPAQLAFQLGGYAFSASDGAHTIALVNDRIVTPAIPPDPAITIDVWQSRAIVDAELVPATNPGGDFAGYAALIEFFDFGSDAFNGAETEPFVPADLSGWSEVRLTLSSLAASGGGTPAIDGRVQVEVRIESWALVPEPGSGLLLAFGVAWIAVRRR